MGGEGQGPGPDPLGFRPLSPRLGGGVGDKASSPFSMSIVFDGFGTCPCSTTGANSSNTLCLFSFSNLCPNRIQPEMEP